MRDNSPVPQREHKTLLQTIDDACIAAAGAATDITNWMLERRGPYMPYFSGSPQAGTIGFYKSFSMLFILTSRLDEMKSHAALIEKIDKWLQPVQMGLRRDEDIKRMQVGIGLFTEYYYALNHSGVVTQRK